MLAHYATDEISPSVAVQRLYRSGPDAWRLRVVFTSVAAIDLPSRAMPALLSLGDGTGASSAIQVVF